MNDEIYICKFTDNKSNGLNIFSMHAYIYDIDNINEKY